MSDKDSNNRPWPSLGCGVGLRSEHYPAVIGPYPPMDFFEAVSENYMNTGGRPLDMLEKVCERYPVALHGVALSIGSTDPLNPHYLSRLKNLVERIQPAIVSDHLCWSGVGGEYLHDLLPLPLTEESIQHVSERVGQVQDYLRRPILLENVSTYVTFQHSVIPEWEFLAEVALRSGCGILLDINNIYVNSVNHGFDPSVYLRHIPPAKVGQFHLAGHTPMGKYIFDTHSARVTEKVWQLYEEALKLYGQVSTLIEWDEEIPSFAELCCEADKARVFYRQADSGIPQAGFWQKEMRLKPSVAMDGAGNSLSNIQHMMKSVVQPFGADLLPENLLNPQGGDPGKERMSVYAGGYLARTHSALSETYEAIEQFLGKEPFCKLAEEYAGFGPSTEYDMAKIGARMESFLRKDALAVENPFLVDLAVFEWRVNLAFHAFDQKPLSAEALQSVAPDDWEKIKLVFQPSVFLVESEWPILELWNARLGEKGMTSRPERQQKPQLLLISRHEKRIRTEVLTRAQYGLLQGLLAGKTLGEVCDELAVFEEDIPLQTWFAAWLHDGLLQRIEISQPA